ncbi:MAG: hypothetical protein ACJAXN_000943 [Psychromonas sp.]|jgi:hypothetical protein
MPIYTYEILPTGNQKTEQFEIFQHITDKPLTVDLNTGFPVRKIFTPGGDIHNKGLKRSTVVNKLSAAATACGCSKGNKL